MSGPPLTLTVTQDTLRVAALSCGYGLFTSVLACGAAQQFHHLWEDTAFATMWWKRADYVLSLVDFANLRPHDFWRWLESSEKADGSFAMGSALCQLTAQAWLGTLKRTLEGFFHFGLYNPALVSGQANFYKDDPVFTRGRQET